MRDVLLRPTPTPASIHDLPGLVGPRSPGVSLYVFAIEQARPYQPYNHAVLAVSVVDAERELKKIYLHEHNQTWRSYALKSIGTLGGDRWQHQAVNGKPVLR